RSPPNTPLFPYTTLFRSFVRQWKDAEQRVCLQLVEKVIQGQPKLTFARENHNLEQANGAYRDRLSAAHRPFERSGLFSRKFLCLDRKSTRLTPVTWPSRM